MANYNTGRLYNHKLPDGGAMYNSAPYAVIVYDGCAGQDAIASLFANIYASDTGEGTETVKATVTLYPITDAGEGQDNISLTANIPVSDTGEGQDNIHSVLCYISVKDEAAGADKISGKVETYFFVDKDGFLQPLGVYVQRDSRQELLPATRDSTEEIPGRHGEIDFGSEFKARAIELHVATEEGNTSHEKEQLKRLFAKYLDPTKGTRKLIFADDAEKTYIVKYAGKIDLTQYPSWFDFIIPFKMSDPLIVGSYEKTLIGEGVIVNEGTFECPILVEIAGPATNPTVSVGTSVLSFTSAIAAGETLVIDTGAMTAKIGSVNAMAYVSGDIDYVLPPNVSVTVVPSVSGTTVKWRDCWL